MARSWYCALHMMGAPHQAKHLDRALGYIRKPQGRLDHHRRGDPRLVANGLKQYQAHLGKGVR